MRLAPLFMLTLLALPACEKTEPPPPAPDTAPAVIEEVAPAEPELTPEEQAKKLQELRENQPEPTLDPADPREKLELVAKKAKSTLKGIYDERFNILTQMRDLKFEADAEEDKKRVRKLADKIEGFAIGDKPEELETAAERFCTLIDELRAEVDPIEAEGRAKLKAIDEQLAALEAKQKEGGKVATSQYEKLEKERKVVSGPMLGGKYVWLAMKTLYQEAFVLADLGARRVQLKLRDCIGKPGAEPVPYELAETERLKALSRAKWYRQGAD